LKELLSVEGQPTKAILAQICTDVFFIRAVSYKISPALFFPQTAC
jgi:hypothetical protein